MRDGEEGIQNSEYRIQGPDRVVAGCPRRGTPGLWDVRALEGRVSRSGSNLVKGE